MREHFFFSSVVTHYDMCAKAIALDMPPFHNVTTLDDEPKNKRKEKGCHGQKWCLKIFVTLDAVVCWQTQEREKTKKPPQWEKPHFIKHSIIFLQGPPSSSASLTRKCSYSQRHWKKKAVLFEWWVMVDDRKRFSFTSYNPSCIHLIFKFLNFLIT